MTYKTPSLREISQLNRCFIEGPASHLAAILGGEDLYRLRTILKSMGANDADFANLGLEPFPQGVASDERGSQPISPLHVMGYKVGRVGLNIFKRWEILKEAFLGDIPKVGTGDYMAEWGEPGTPERLKKLANYIASNCRNMKSRRDSRSDDAIQDWETDLKWLEEQFYTGSQSGFLWPNTIA